MAAPLPEAEWLFERFVAPHYPADGPPGQLRADAEQGLFEPGASAAEACGLEPEVRTVVEEEFAEMRDAALGDLSEFLQSQGRDVEERVAPSLEDIDAVDRFWTATELLALVGRAGGRGGDAAEYFLNAVELGIVLGEALCGLVPACRWLHDWPYWESAILHPPSGDVVNVFHWAVNRLSASGAGEGDTLVLKLNACAEQLKRG